MGSYLFFRGSAPAPSQTSPCLHTRLVEFFFGKCLID